MNESPTRKPCLFCGSTENKLTKQHVFAEQMGKYFEGITGKVGIASIRIGNEAPKTFLSAPFSDAIGGFCEYCNNRWMNDIENEAISVLGGMMSRGTPRILTPANQLALSTFAVMTALVLDHQTPKNRTVPGAEYGTFYATQTPGTNHLVWIGKTDPRISEESVDWEESVNTYLAQSRSGKIRPDREGNDPDFTAQILRAAPMGQWLYVFTFSIGFVAFQVMGHNLAEAVKFELGAEHRSVFTEIWPVQGEASWPPSILINKYGGVQGMQDVMTGPQAS